LFQNSFFIKFVDSLKLHTLDNQGDKNQINLQKIQKNLVI